MYLLNPSVLGFCPICTLEYQFEDTISQLPCHENHILHEMCYGQLSAFNKTKGVKGHCPTCRAEIVPEGVLRKVLKATGKVDAPMEEPDRKLN